VHVAYCIFAGADLIDGRQIGYPPEITAYTDDRDHAAEWI